MFKQKIIKLLTDNENIILDSLYPATTVSSLVSENVDNSVEYKKAIKIAVKWMQSENILFNYNNL